MAIIVNDITPPHTIKQVESKQVPYATKELLDRILENNPKTGVKRKKYYIIDTNPELRTYPEDRKEFRIFEKFLYMARRLGASLVMIKFDK